MSKFMNVVQRASGDFTSEQYAIMRKNIFEDKPIIPNPGVLDYATKILNFSDPIFYGGMVAGTVGLLQRGEVGLGITLGASTAAGYVISKASALWNLIAHRDKTQAQVYEEFVSNRKRMAMEVGGLVLVAMGTWYIEMASAIKLMNIGEIGYGAGLITAIAINTPLVMNDNSLMLMLRVSNKERDLFEKADAALRKKYLKKD
jgi:hypothetical protein